jgi:hypothetical protein
VFVPTTSGTDGVILPGPAAMYTAVEKTDVLRTGGVPARTLGCAARRMTDRPRPLARVCTVFNVQRSRTPPAREGSCWRSQATRTGQRHVAGGYCHGMERKGRGQSAGPAGYVFAQPCIMSPKA